MTISTTSNTTIAQGNGLTTSFDFLFPVPLASELFVYYTDSNGSRTLLASAQYTVTGIGTANGGSVTYPASGSPIASGTSLTIQRIVPYVQQTDLVNQSGYYPNVVENALDYLTMQTQQLAQGQQLTLQAPLESVQENLVLPTASQRANTVVGFNAAGGVEVLPIPASVGAGDMRVEEWTDGVDYVSGTSTSVNLSRSYGTKANLGSIVMQGVAQDPGSYMLNGTVLTFNSVIPLGVGKIWGIGGTTLSVNAAGSIEANVVGYGADPTGVIDSTSAFVAAIGTGLPVVAPEGIFKTGAITWPSGSRFRGLGNGTLIVPVAGFSALAFWSTQNAGSDIELHNFAMNLPVATFPNSVPLFCNPGDRIYVHDLYIQEGGTIGLYSNGLTNSIQERVVVQKAATVGIIMQTGADCTIRDCAVSNIAQSHGISVQDSSTVIVSECRASTVGGFGITMQRCVNSQINSSRTHNSTLEGITAGGDGGDNVDVYGNICTWDPGVSQDFGMSIAANGNGGTFRIRFRGNTIRGCGKSGIALAGDSTAGWSVLSCEVSENTIIDSNQLGLGPVNGGGAGVILYGSFCTGHRVANNTFIDSGGGKLNYGVFETQIGAGGFPSRNTFFNNSTYGQSGARVNKQGNSAEAFCQDPEQPYLSWAPAPGAGSGALSAVTTLAAFYIEKQAEVSFYAEFQITNNGSAASTFTFTLPFTAAFGMGSGRENVLSGAGLVVSIVGNLATVRTVGNAYPGGTNAVIEVAGNFVRTF